MARAIWKGVLVLGRLRVPVKLYSAVTEKTVRFHLLHDQDMTRVRQRMVNASTGEEVTSQATQRGVQVAPGRFVLVKPEELARIDPPESRDIAVERFVAPELINHQWYERPYYLGPDGSAGDYAALAAALAEQQKEGVARWVMRRREYVGALRSRGDHLLLISLRFAGEVLTSDDLTPIAGRKPDDREIKMAEQLVEALAGEFKPGDFRDTYRERLLEFIEKKAKGRKPRLHKPVKRKPAVRDLSQILEASLHAVQKERASA